MNFELFATLIIAHVLGDFALQTDQVYRLKTQGGLGGLAVHVIIHLIATVFLIRPTEPLSILLFLLNLGVIHYLIDWVKLKTKSERNYISFVVDQIAHFSHLILLTYLFPDLQGVINSPWVYALALYSLLPIVTMCMWVWSFDQEGKVNDSQLVAEWRMSMKSISQAFGWPLICCMAISIYFFFMFI